MHNLAFEVFQARNFRLHRFLIAVIACARNDPFCPIHDRPHLLPLAAADLYLEPPPLLTALPVCSRDFVPEPDLVLEVELLRRLIEIRHYAITACNWMARLPRIELEAQGVQVGIGSHTWVPELRPCSTKLVTRFEDGKGRVGQRLLNAVSGIDAAKTTADDEDVEVGVGRRPVGGRMRVTVHGCEAGSSADAGCSCRYATPLSASVQ